MKLLSLFKALFSSPNNTCENLRSTNLKANASQFYDPKAWEDLAELFASHNNDLNKEVVLAITNPIEYDRQFPDRLNNRNMKSIENAPIIALIDGLLERNLAMGLDWKASMEEFHEETIRVTAGKIQHEQWLDALNDSPSEAFTEHLEQIKRTFNAEGYTIIGLDNDSDEYNLILVPLTAFDEVQLKLTNAKCKFFTLEQMILES